MLSQVVFTDSAELFKTSCSQVRNVSNLKNLMMASIIASERPVKRPMLGAILTSDRQVNDKVSCL
jgi:hypothetical protein